MTGAGQRGLPLLLVLALVWALPAFADDFKVPPTPDHHVTDPAGALTAAARTALENELQTYETATGHQILVWIGQTTGDVPLETWTGQTADRWKIGRRGHDDGAVLFVFMADHKLRIEVGYGLEGSLPDAAAHRIIADDITPRMKRGDVDGAVSSGVAAMLTTITPAFKVAEPAPSPPDLRDASRAILAVIVLGFVLLVFVGRIASSIRYGYLVTREGKVAARKDMGSWLLWTGMGAGMGGGSSFDGGGGGFSAGGGGFGGGGASGGW
ncbi:MAG: TPM domain-containing protein [Candidatus Tumulicola sp.]